MSTSEHVALARELFTLIERRIVDPLEILFGSDEQVGPVRERLRIEAEVWAAQLLGRDDRLAVRTAARLIAAVFPGDGPFDPPDEWWRTAFGRAVARRAGHPGKDAVSFATAGAMLGITRQGVHDLVKRAKLDRHPDGGVTTESIRERLNQPQERYAARHDHR
ncbi:hypothetical protein HNP84_002372 [Thermocatellispora tengchongensis]|uniref:MftR C-terminal domain-containing protein n=1 Tax=Thermocatellispora tengchongensis TaxID=1073253 RepID=A0A840P2D6_9ACTN|nr:hypothetical protein [Thermocatellispora tengchongensis]MBB5132656.1 hypothetical protein [Thermocatellispora tengchongensis]